MIKKSRTQTLNPTPVPSDPRSNPNRLLVRALRGESLERTPIWLMRQAGRYLPEYRKIRGQVETFLDLCFTPELAVEVTLQPIRRFGFDGAILFSDILVIPHALGQTVSFEEGQGPRLTPLAGPADLAGLDDAKLEAVLAPVYRSVEELRGALPDETALIGFAGAPWTVATYMVEGGGSRDFAAVKAWAYGEPESFGALIDLLVEATARHLVSQAKAGADALQIFDTWAGVLPEPELRRWSLGPIREIVARVRQHHPEIPIIVFPRGAGVLYRDFALEVAADGLSLDSAMPLAWARDHLQRQAVLQGNLDPAALVVGGQAMAEAARRILETLGPNRLVFNLGHGVLPQTPPENVADLVELVRSWKP
jgi:uroporphyrinogen decarboxylase